MTAGKERSSEWTSASNIALIKYWGKKPGQLPENPSLSITLDNSVTRTRVTASNRGIEKVRFFFGGAKAPDFEPKILTFLTNIESYFPFLKDHSFHIESSNTFPHSAGIASSASSMSALALCISELSGGFHSSDPEFYRRASGIARLGSGSASRSVFGGFVVWGKTTLVPDSSDEWAVPVKSDIHQIFSKMQDSILIVSSGKKKVSSTVGHRMMDKHPYAKMRYRQANINLKNILDALKTGNTDNFTRIVENEALGLHSLMMSSDPGFMLLEPETIRILQKIRDFREKTGLFLCFTLDAGPNVHLLYPEINKEAVREFIHTELLQYCESGTVIHDKCGVGPTRISLAGK